MKHVGTRLSALAIVALCLAGTSNADTPRATRKNDTLALPSMAMKPATAKKQTLAKPTLRKDGWVSYTLLVEATAHRDAQAKVWFKVPELFRGAQTRIRVGAYNDDPTYTRCLHLDLDGHGGYVESSPARKGSTQSYGSGVLAQGQTIQRLWSVADMKFRADMRGKDLTQVLDAKAEHTLTSWVSTYARYGQGSWVTVRLEFRLLL